MSVSHTLRHGAGDEGIPFGPVYRRREGKPPNVEKSDRVEGLMRGRT